MDFLNEECHKIKLLTSFEIFYERQDHQDGRFILVL